MKGLEFCLKIKKQLSRGGQGAGGRGGGTINIET